MEEVERALHAVLEERLRQAGATRAQEISLTVELPNRGFRKADIEELLAQLAFQHADRITANVELYASADASEPARTAQIVAEGRIDEEALAGLGSMDDGTPMGIGEGEVLPLGPMPAAQPLAEEEPRTSVIPSSVPDTTVTVADGHSDQQPTYHVAPPPAAPQQAPDIPLAMAGSRYAQVRDGIRIDGMFDERFMDYVSQIIENEGLRLGRGQYVRVNADFERDPNNPDRILVRFTTEVAEDAHSRPISNDVLARWDAALNNPPFVISISEAGYSPSDIDTYFARQAETNGGGSQSGGQGVSFTADFSINHDRWITYPDPNTQA